MPVLQRKCLKILFLFCRKVKYFNFKASFVNKHTVCGVLKGGKEVGAYLPGSWGTVPACGPG